MNIDEDVVIPCPLTGFALRRAINCLNCSHYSGMAIATVDGEPIKNPSIDEMQVVCAKPITRRMQRIVE